MAKGKGKTTAKKGRASHRQRAKKRPATPATGKTRKRGGRSPSITRRIKDTERAIETLGRNVRRGTNVLGKTRKLTPTKSGFRAVSRVLKEINKVSKVGKKRVFTYDLKASFKGPDGKQKTIELKGVGIPRLKDVRPFKGESREEALNRTVEARIRRELFANIIKGSYKQHGVKFGPKMSREAAAEQLRKLKKSRDAHFTVTFNRET